MERKCEKKCFHIIRRFWQNNIFHITCKISTFQTRTLVELVAEIDRKFFGIACNIFHVHVCQQFIKRRGIADDTIQNTLRGINLLSRRGNQRSTHVSFVTVNEITSVLGVVARDNAITILTQVFVASIIFTKIP